MKHKVLEKDAAGAIGLCLFFFWMPDVFPVHWLCGFV